MNNKQRDLINKWISDIEEIKEGVESMQEEEQDKFDNMPENLQCSERGEQMQFCIESLESAVESIDDAIAYLDETRL